MKGSILGGKVAKLIAVLAAGPLVWEYLPRLPGKGEK